VHIERLILDGLPVTQGPLVQAAVEGELARLLSHGNSTARFNTGGALASLKGGSIQVAKGAGAAGLGAQIAAAVYGGLGGQP